MVFNYKLLNKKDSCMGFNFGVIFVMWAIAQYIAGYYGIVAYAGTEWAIAVILLSLIFRFTLPITVAAFYGAMEVWDCSWYLSVLIAAPVLYLVIPNTLLSVYSNIEAKHKSAN